MAEYFASATVILWRQDGTCIQVDVPKGHRIEASIDPHSRAYGPRDFAHADRVVEPDLDGLSILIDVRRGTETDVIATATVGGSNEVNRCPECRLIAAHLPLCSRPVPMPWEA